MIDAPKRTYRNRWKWIFDVAIAVALLIVILPVTAVLMILAAVGGSSPIFDHPHTGYSKRTFRCFKVRTMDVDAQMAKLLAEEPIATGKWVSHRKLQKVPRIAAVGRFLLRTSLDELPRLWNVMRCDMSIVNRQPTTVDEIQLYDASAYSWVQVSPKLTGLWQAFEALQCKLCRASRIRSRPCREPYLRPEHLDHSMCHARSSAGDRVLNRLVA